MKWVKDMYESPIYIYTKELQSKLDGNILTAVHSYGISVDRDELIKALHYDRMQYDYGYADGLRRANKTAITMFAEQVKMLFYEEFDEIIPSIMADKIDNLVKEFTEVEDDLQRKIDD